MVWYVPGLENPVPENRWTWRMPHARDLLWYPWSKTGFYQKDNLLTSFCMYSIMCSHTIRCGPSHTTICTYRFEVDILLERIPLPSLTLAQHTDLTQKYLWGRGSWRRCRSTSWQRRICTKLQHASTTLATRYQTSRSTLMTFPKLK